LFPIDSRAARNRPYKKPLQFPVLSIIARNKARGDNSLSYPLWRLFGSLIVLLFLRTKKPIRIDLLSTFLKDLRGLRKTVFLLKVLRSCFYPFPNKEKLLLWDLKLRKEKYKLMFSWPQNGRSRSTESSNLSGEEFSFLQPLRKHDDRCTFKWVLNTDHGLKAASWT